MFERLIDIFSQSFMIRGLIVALLIAVCASILGVSLVLKRFSMIGDGLSHVAFGAYCIATALEWTPLYVSLPVTIVCAILLLMIKENSKIKGDVAIAIISSMSLALGYAISKTSKTSTGDICNFLFGSIYSLSEIDVVLSIILSICVVVFYIVLYNKIFMVTFDENYARASGINVTLYNGIIATFTAVTVVLGMRMMGALLISAIIIFPAISSMRLFKNFKAVVICSAIISFFSIGMGIVIDGAVESGPGPGPLFVLMNVLFYIVFFVISIIKKRIRSKKGKNDKLLPTISQTN